MAAEKMLKFTGLGRSMPDKRDAGARKGDFHEIYGEFIAEKAAAQASRCSQCGVPFCQVHCPLHNNIPDWLKLTAEGRLEEAYELSSATNSMPEICGRICPQDRLCEGNCVIEQSGHGTVTIGAVEKYITETAWSKGWVKPIAVGKPTGRSVGIIGAGPAGLAAAEELRRKGHDVHIYDRYDRAGGLLIYGIPNFKLEKDVVQRRTQRLADAGIHFHHNADIGRTHQFADLRARHDAMLIATGVYKARALEVPGATLPQVLPAMRYLTAANRIGLGDVVPDHASGLLDAKGKRVVVIGGGDTAMDCVRTAIRQGASSVSCLYRRDRANMPGSLREVAHAEEEGVNFIWLSQPVEITGKTKVEKVRAHRMRLGLADASGRQTPEEIPNSTFSLDADLVISALGFEPEDCHGLFGEKALALSGAGTISADPRTKETSVPGIYAAGDIVRGASLVVWAIRDGRDAARAIDRALAKMTKTAMAAE
ncbi:MAG TPA: NAD(P)-dependent oxidoreductase [Micropepsaceae bacterium]|nr:NAD(P)-dependent oxidoreductase [Micropepsaceae bacterium]